MIRDTFLDTSKGLLIFLVVFGHFLEELVGWQSDATRSILATIYLFHMPAFVFISGVFFKDKDIFRKLIYFASILIPFHILYVIFDFIIRGNISLSWFIQPYWILWYLVGMIAWTFLTPILKRSGFPVLISVVLAIAVGFSPVNNYYFSLGRIFTFLPFFVIGSVYGKQIAALIKDSKVLLYISPLIFIISIAYFYHFEIKRQWLYGSFNYTQLEVGLLQGAFTRGFIIIISCVVICSFLSIATLIKDKFTTLGGNTLPVYLLHGYIVMLVAYFASFENVYCGIVISVILACLTCILLKQYIFNNMITSISKVTKLIK